MNLIFFPCDFSMIGLCSYCVWQFQC